MSKQELSSLKLSTGRMTEPCTGAAKVAGSHLVDGGLFADT
jgi:hypothetical protein